MGTPSVISKLLIKMEFIYITCFSPPQTKILIANALSSRTAINGKINTNTVLLNKLNKNDDDFNTQKSESKRIWTPILY